MSKSWFQQKQHRNILSSSLLEPHKPQQYLDPFQHKPSADCPPQNWLNTPDGRQGWASYFLNQGYTLYLTDQPQRGRSPWLPGDGTLTNYNVSFIQNYFTTTQVAKLWPQATLHTQVRCPLHPHPRSQL